jgi:hypothetical protein
MRRPRRLIVDGFGHSGCAFASVSSRTALIGPKTDEEPKAHGRSIRGRSSGPSLPPDPYTFREGGSEVRSQSTSLQRRPLHQEQAVGLGANSRGVLTGFLLDPQRERPHHRRVWPLHDEASFGRSVALHVRRS